MASTDPPKAPRPKATESQRAASIERLLRSQGVPLAKWDAFRRSLSDEQAERLVAEMPDGEPTPGAVGRYRAILAERRIKARKAVESKATDKQAAVGKADAATPNDPADLPAAPNPANEPQTPVEGGQPGPQSIDRPDR